MKNQNVKAMLIKVAVLISSLHVLLSLQACSNTKPSMDPGTMRIWLAPSHRSETDADPKGNIYIKVHPNQ